MSLLNIKSVDESHSGEYKCVVSNEYGSSSSVSQINITGI